MTPELERNLLETEVSVLTEQLHELGHGLNDTSPKQDGTLTHLSTPDLRRMKNELRDLVRTLGGARRS